MLHEFLQQNEKEILAMTEHKTLDLAGGGPSSIRLKRGLPIFYTQLMTVLKLENASRKHPPPDKSGVAEAARNSDEPAMAAAASRPEEIELAKSAGFHGVELLRLGYTLSHVVHAYGAMCQSITELASRKNFPVTALEFHDLNQCLDVAIAGAVTEYQSEMSAQTTNREVESLGFLAHELRNALNRISISYQLIKKGAVGSTGSTSQVLERGLRHMNELINRSLTNVRMRSDSKMHFEYESLLQIVDQIGLIAEIEAKAREQTLEVQIDPTLILQADQHLFHSALSNLIQNALKYTPIGGKIHVRGKLLGKNIVVEVEDECGGLPEDKIDELFTSFVRASSDKSGLGLGLVIAQRAIRLHGGDITVKNMPGKGCTFSIVLPHIQTGKVNQKTG